MIKRDFAKICSELAKFCMVIRRDIKEKKKIKALKIQEKRFRAFARYYRGGKKNESRPENTI